jgi:hypothetical protein
MAAARGLGADGMPMLQSRLPGCKRAAARREEAAYRRGPTAARCRIPATSGSAGRAFWKRGCVGRNLAKVSLPLARSYQTLTPIPEKHAALRLPALMIN